MENRNEQTDPRNEEPVESHNPKTDNPDRNNVSGEPDKRQEEERESVISKEKSKETGLGVDSIQLEEGDDPAETGRQSGDRAEEQHEPLK